MAAHELICERRKCAPVSHCVNIRAQKKKRHRLTLYAGEENINAVGRLQVTVRKYDASMGVCDSLSK